MITRILTALSLSAVLSSCHSGTAYRTETDDYFEHHHDGRIYVVGSAESLRKLEESHHLPYTRTNIGAGPGGKTVIFEVDKDDEALADRLERRFTQRHGTR